MTCLQRALSHATADRPEACVNLAGGRTQDQGDDRVASNFDVLECPKNVDFTASREIDQRR